MLIELKDINNEVFGINPDHIVITYRKKDTDIYVLRTLVEDREVDAGTMVYLHSMPTLSLSIIKLDEKELAKCKTQQSKMFPQLNPHVTIVEPATRNYFPQDTTQLTANIIDSKETVITWATSDANIATVNAGLVTFLKEGSVAITASNPNIPAPSVIMLTISPVSLTVGPTTVDLYQDSAKFQLMAIAVPNEKVSWSSKNQSIATVDTNGLVTAVGPGSVDIEASLRGKKVTSRITVATPSITLNVQDSVNVNIDKTLQVTATVENLNNKNVTWESMNPSIATVVDGLITPVTSGSVIIKAKVGSIEKTVNVTVPQVVINATNTLSMDTDTTVNWTVSCTGTSVKPTLSSLNPDIVIINQAGLVTAIAEGDATIRATVHGVTKDCAVTVSAPVTP